MAGLRRRGAVSICSIAAMARDNVAATYVNGDARGAGLLRKERSWYWFVAPASRTVGHLLSQTLAGYTIGLDPTCPSHWDVYFADYLIGTVDLTTLRFSPITTAFTSPIKPV